MSMTPASNPTKEAVERTFNPPRLAGLYCRASWHLRKNPRAAVLHDLALQITSGGLTEFYLSQRQVAKYFGWGRSSTQEAFEDCEQEGFFFRTVTGRGGKFGQPSFANSYVVLTHKQVAEEGKHPCLCAENEGTRTLMGPGVHANGTGGARIRDQYPHANGTSVSDVESTSESPKESTNENQELSPSLLEPTPKPSGKKKRTPEQREYRGLLMELGRKMEAARA